MGNAVYKQLRVVKLQSFHGRVASKTVAARLTVPPSPSSPETKFELSATVQHSLQLQQTLLLGAWKFSFFFCSTHRPISKIGPDLLFAAVANLKKWIVPRSV